jgi:TRAP-type mannitol/chloroaromatic compound transport system permease small subunit
MARERRAVDWLLLAAALVAVVAFLLPWISAGEVSLAAHQLAGFAPVTQELRQALGGPVIAYWGDLFSRAYWLIPLLAAATVLLVLLRSPPRAGIATALGLILLLLLINIAVALGNRFAAGVGAGAWLALACGFVLFFGGIAAAPIAYLSFVDRLSMWVGHAFAWCIMVLALGIAYEVFVRYALRAPTTWAYDLSYMMYGALFLMAGAYTLSRNGHVRGDVVYRRWSVRRQAATDAILYAFFLLPGTAALVYSGWIYAARSWRFGEVSIFSPTGVPVYPMKTLIPIAGVLLFLQGVGEIVRCLEAIRTDRWPRRMHDVEELETLLHQPGSDAAAPAVEHPR